MGNIMVRWGVLAALVASGCGSSSSPADKCQDLVDTVCGRLATCLNVPAQRADCIRAAGASLSCSAAKSVSASYDTCMDDLEALSCDALLDTDSNGDPEPVLPTSCHGVILIGRLGPPSTSFTGIRDAAHVIGP